MALGTKSRRETFRHEMPLDEFSEGRKKMGSESYKDTLTFVRQRVRGLRITARRLGNIVRFDMAGTADQLTAAKKLFGLND